MGYFFGEIKNLKEISSFDKHDKTHSEIQGIQSITKEHMHFSCFVL